MFQKAKINVSNHGDTNILTRERKNSIFTARDEDMISQTYVIKRYIYSPGNRTVIFFFMDIRVSEASKCA